MGKWLDVSYSKISRQWAENRKAEGITGLIQCSLAWPGRPEPLPWAGENLYNGRSGGLATMTYMAIGGEEAAPVPSYILSARDVCGSEWLRCLMAWIDIEVKLGQPEQAMDLAVETTEQLGLPAGFYASLTTWNYYARGTTKYQGTLGWQALWDRNPSLANIYKFGGLVFAGKQYDHDKGIDGVDTDVSVFDESLLPQKEEDLNKLETIAAVLQYSGTQAKLVKESGPDVYVVNQHGKRLFPGGAGLFIQVGYQWNQVITVPDGTLACIPDWPEEPK